MHNLNFIEDIKSVSVLGLAIKLKEKNLHYFFSVNLDVYRPFFADVSKYPSNTVFH